MTGSKCLLDTSIIIDAFRDSSGIYEQLDTIAEIFVPVIVEGELYCGAYKSANPEKHIKQIDAFLLNCKTLIPDTATADMYGKVKATLIKSGKPIPENDIWIAALALQYNLPLYTIDKHFTEIGGIILL